MSNPVGMPDSPPSPPGGPLTGAFIEVCTRSLKIEELRIYEEQVF